MLRRPFILWVPAVAAACTLALAAPAHAVTAPVVWSAPGMGASGFSVDGSLALAIANTSAGGRLEVRRASTGGLVQVVTNQFKFTAATLSPDNQLALVTLSDMSSGLGVRVIRIHRVADGALIRTIATVAERELTSINVSADGGLVAAMDARSYERGGQVHVHRVSNGATVRVLTMPATTAAVRFSPDGRYLATNDRFTVAGRFVAGIRILRTSDWAPVLTITDGSTLVRWSFIGTTIWTTHTAYLTPTSLRLTSVPDGTAVRTVGLAEYDSIVDVSNDDRFVLTGRWAAPRRSLKVTDTVTGAAVTYDFGADVFGGDISPDATLFSYALTAAPSTFNGYAARL